MDLDLEEIAHLPLVNFYFYIPNEFYWDFIIRKMKGGKKK